jgi:2-polyprenyl-3-methyl-5-hydroxy-6-metoxy-1,4-benzoquinol methylase
LTDPDPRWERFAAREPHFAVLTDPRFLRANLTPAHEREFFASGEALTAWMLGVIDAALAPQFAPMTTLEYGCGLGRLALPLARRPGAVTAVDRSPVMLDHARREAERRGLGHIVFQTPAQLFEQPRTFDLVVCYHLLQRIERQDALALVRRLVGLIGPGGVGVFQWPYRADLSPLVGASRWFRERVPGANALANRFRGKAADDPFIPTHVLDLADLLPEFDAREFQSTQLALEHQEDLDYATVLAYRGDRRAPAPPAPSRRDPRGAAGGRDDESVTGEEIDAFNRTAETYFSSLTGWDHHLAKPFSQIEETPTLLTGVAVLLQALRLTPGMTVLEFGAGSGWLSRFLTQMGCRVILLDVSPTALQMARALYDRQPVVGDQPAPDFLLFDGRRIDRPDASVDRIICFDAFHHAANPRAIIREFARVLTAGGIAGFAEPGPRHAEAPRSRFESHTYGVVEKDVDIHDVWRTAQGCGFADLRMCVFHGPPHHVPLHEYEELLAGGPAGEAWLASTRRFLRHVRSFYLVKGGAVASDSRTADGLACDVRAALASPQPVAGSVAVEAIVTNTGAATWLASPVVPGGVSLGTHLYDESGALLRFDFQVTPLTDPPRAIVTGETVRCRVTLPPLAPGRYRLELDCVAAEVAWFAQSGSRPATLSLEV